MEQIRDILFGTLDVFLDYPYSFWSMIISIFICIFTYVLVVKCNGKNWTFFVPTIISAIISGVSFLALLFGGGGNVSQILNLFLFTICSTVVTGIVSVLAIILRMVINTRMSKGRDY